MAAIRGQEAETRERLAATQRQLGKASEELEASHAHLGRLRDHLRVALDALRERLVAMYESGNPELIDVLIGEGDLEDIDARTEYLDRVHQQDEATASRVRALRDGVALTVEKRAAAKGEIEAARNRIAGEQQSLVATRGELAGSPGPAGRREGRPRSGARPGAPPRNRARRRRRSDPGQDRRTADRDRLGAAARAGRSKSAAAR